MIRRKAETRRHKELFLLNKYKQDLPMLGVDSGLLRSTVK